MDRYCEIYVFFTSEKEELIRLLKDIVKGKSDRNVIRTEIMEIYVDKNDSFDYELAKDVDKGFIYYHFILEIDLLSPNLTIVVESVADLLKQLWLKDIPAVAACDFEELLPNFDGKKNRNFIPRVK
jgi:hypothetical protein